MKTYRNEKNGFEIDIPDDWGPAPIPGFAGKDLFQYGCANEAFNFEIGPLFPEPLPADTETEFTVYARDNGFQNLVFGRIRVGGKEHVCAHYEIRDWMGTRWNKKYMIVFGRTEYNLTGTCNDPRWFASREKDWDAIVRSFRLLSAVDESASAGPEIERERAKRREITARRIAIRDEGGDLYARGYEAARLWQFKEARSLLEQCLRENPDHALAHKELAFVLQMLEDIPGAIRHRQEAARLDPNDYQNQAKLEKLKSAGGYQESAVLEREIGPKHPWLGRTLRDIHHFTFEDKRVTFFACLIVLALTDFGLWNGMLGLKSIWCPALSLLAPVYGMYITGPWVGIPRKLSGLVGAALYVLFLILALR